jgi:hypothetical protein
MSIESLLMSNDENTQPTVRSDRRSPSLYKGHNVAIVHRSLLVNSAWSFKAVDLERHKRFG